MKDLYFRYNPEPSKTLLDRGQVVDGSYFLADGLLHFGDNETIECEFEVAHMQSGICWAVVYFPFPDEAENHPVWEKHQLEEKVQWAVKLHGKDRLFRRDVEVQLDTWGGQKGNSMFPGLRIVYMVSEYTVTLDAETQAASNLAVFELANLPIAQHYSPQVTREVATYEYLGGVSQESLRAALEQVIQSSNNKTVEELLEMGIEIAQQKTDELLGNSPPIYRKTIPIQIDGKKVGWLQWYRKYEEREYISQPLAQLIIDNREIPPSWNSVDISEWIAALLSLALGRMVTWNYYYASPENRDELKPKELWISRTLQEHRFTAFTEAKNQLSIHGFDEKSYAIQLVTDVLSQILQNPIDKTEDYLSALSDYIYYASTSGDAQQRCTLLCALVENVFSSWEANSDTDIGKEIPKQHSRKIQKTAKTAISAIIEEVLPKKTSETNDEYKKRCKEFLDRIGNSIGNNLSKSFVFKLSALFEEHGWLTHIIDLRIKAFVRSRDKLFHEHRFADDDPVTIPDVDERSRKIIAEIVNIEMFVPLLLVTLLQYRGRYWDRVQNNWAWMPTMVSKEQDT